KDAPEELVALGEIESKTGRVAVFSLVRAVTDGDVMNVLRRLRLACGRATPAVLVPRGRSLGGAGAEVGVPPGGQLRIGGAGQVGARLAEECGVADDVAPSRFATKEAPLVLSVKRNEAWYGEVRLLLTENQLAMLFALARATGWVKSVELGGKIAPSAEIPD